jgi:hypothetical protein
MFTTLAVAMTLSGAVAIETPIRAAADRPALVQVASNGMMKISGKHFHKKPMMSYGMYGKPKFIIHEKFGKPSLHEKFGKRMIIDEKFRRPLFDEKLRKPIIDEKFGKPGVVVPQIKPTGPSVLRPLEPNKGNAGGAVIQPLPGNGANNNSLAVDQRLGKFDQKR